MFGHETLLLIVRDYYLWRA